MHYETERGEHMKMIRDELKGYCGEVEYRGTDGLLWACPGENQHSKIFEPWLVPFFEAKVWFSMISS